MAAIMFCLLSLAIPSAVALNSLVYGPGSLELRLLTAKLAARAGGDAAIFAGQEAKDLPKQWRSLMYGNEYAEAGFDAPGCARVLTTVEELGECLSSVNSLVIVCDSAPLADGVVSTLFSNTGECLRRIVLVSRMGVSRAKPPGLFGFGGDDAALAATEASLREATQVRGLEMSIVRVGTLKGGGPGSDERDDLGLSKVFYNGIIDLSSFMTTQSYDKFTNGAKVSTGDPFDLANPLLRAGRQSSFDPFDNESSRVVAAGAAVHALSHPTTVEVTVSAASGEEPPTQDEWANLFNQL